MANDRQTARMFGTPPEPLFNHKVCGVTTEMLQDWITMLMKKNVLAVDSAKPVQGASIMHDSVQFLFLTCKHFKMSSEVKYLSLELFDRFMIKHIQDLHDYVTGSSNIKSRKNDWLEIQKRVTNQVILRVVSCVQIASKLTSHYRILSPNKARRFLLMTGHRYNAESIMQSELRVLKTLNFCVSVPSPLVYMESLLEIMGETDPDMEVKVLHGVSQSLLDLVYLQFDDVYAHLHQLASAGSPITQNARDKFASVRADKMLLMVTLITTAAYILDRETHTKILYQLSKMTRIPPEDIADFSSVILQILAEDTDENIQSS